MGGKPWPGEGENVESSQTSTSTLKKINFLASLVVCTVVWVGGLVFTSVATAYPNIFGLNSTIGNVSEFFFLQVTPAGYTFAIWGLIYLWQAAWIVYVWTFVVRIKEIPTVPTTFLWMYAVANVFPPVWTVLWCKYLPIASLPALMATPFIQYFALASAHVYFKDNLKSFGKGDAIATRILVHNGVAFYTTWVSIAWQLNLGVVLQFFAGVDPAVTAGIILTSTAVQLVLYFVLEQTVFREAMKYTHSIYPVVTWATVGICVAHWNRTDEAEFNHVFALLLSILSAVFEFLHICINVLCINGANKKGKSTLTNTSVEDEHMLQAK
jgi:hypothetical protein